MSFGRTFLISLVPMLMFPATWAKGEDATPEPQCFDAVVLARVIRQIPSEIPDCGRDCIVWSWPWFLDLSVEEVLRGRAPRGRFTALSIQHTYVHRDRQRWWLRRNSLEEFNVVSFGKDGSALPRCKAGAPPAEPYLRPPEGASFQDLVRERVRTYRSEE